MATKMAVDNEGSVEKRMNMSLDDIIKQSSKSKKAGGPRGKGTNVSGKRGKVRRRRQAPESLLVPLSQRVRRRSDALLALFLSALLEATRTRSCLTCRARLLANLARNQEARGGGGRVKVVPRKFADKRQVCFWTGRALVCYMKHQSPGLSVEL